MKILKRGTMKTVKAGLLAVLAVVAPAAAAEGTGFAGYADGAHKGLELALGYKAEAKTGTAIAVHPLQGVIYSTDPPDGYREETFSNGNTVCRNLSNGRFADKENCEGGAGFEYTPSVELTQRITYPVSIGVGYRAGKESGAYGTLKIMTSERVYLAIRGGSEYRGLAIGAHF